MADLPRSRVATASRPFEICGIDYAGPIIIRESQRRGRIPTSKGYIAVFVCFKTKAIHLELVSALDTELFLVALKKFTSRRGVPSHIHSDNGSNFLEASNELKALYEFLEKEKSNLATAMAMEKITWHFMPPQTPHFGGLWEAAVKSMKKHLKITMQSLTYTFEEYSTLLTEIEGILNSRPITPLSSNPNDFEALTPAHFLTGSVLRQPAEHNFLDTADT